MAGDEKLIPNEVERPVAVLAHPDDEALWCAGLICGSNLPWTVICCSIPPHEPPRAWRFFDACEVLGARPRLMPFEERHSLNLSLLDLNEFDFIVTHGEAGEYGHLHHQQVHAHVRQRWGEKARYIGYGGEGRFRLPLDEVTRARKLQAIKCYVDGESPKWKLLLKLYGRQFDLWEERYD